MLLGGLGAFIAIAGVAGLIFLFQRDDGAVEVSQASVPTELAVTLTPDAATSQIQEAIKRELGGFVPLNPYAMVNWPKPVLENAAFDILKFVEPPPANENAAPFYLDALFEFSPELEPCFVGAPNLSDRLKAIKERVKLDRVFAKPYSTENAAEWKSTLKLYDEGFSKMAIAQRRPKCMFQHDFSFVPWPVARAAYPFGIVAKNLSIVKLREGDFAAPIQTVDIMLRLSRDVRNSKRSRFIDAGLEEMAESTIREMFSTPGMKIEYCDQLLSSLDRHFRELGDDTLSMLQGDYVFQRLFVYELMTHTGFFSGERMRKEVIRFDFWRGFTDSADSLFSRIALGALPNSNGPTPQENDRANMEKFKAAAASVDLKREFQFVDNLLQKNLGLAKKSFPERWAGSRTRNDDIWIGDALDMSKFYLAHPAVQFEKIDVYNFTTDRTKLHALMALVALGRWQFKHNGKLPTSLEEVMMDAGYPDLPIDVFSNKPLRLTILKGEPVIYSVGPNGVDEQAKIESNFALQQERTLRFKDEPTQSEGDLIFRLPSGLKWEASAPAGR